MCMLQFINLNVIYCCILLAVLIICCDTDKECNHIACKDMYFVITVLCIVRNIHSMDFYFMCKITGCQHFQ
jgi:hypothetical protein